MRTDFKNKTAIMGVINITPDSFSDGGLYLNPLKAVQRANQQLKEGVSILDIGAQSTRPGAEYIQPEIEWKRLFPALKAIRTEFPSALISVDTFSSTVASKALQLGANWINDISGGNRDPEILKVVADANCPYVITHSRGNSKTMNQLCVYNHLINDILDELNIATESALNSGILAENIIWDPGLGFAKDTNHNLEILRNLEVFTKAQYPILVGPSRKRFIGEVLNEEDSEKRLFGTLAVICRCIEAKVAIVRVHDIAPTFKTVQMAKCLWK